MKEAKVKDLFGYEDGYPSSPGWKEPTTSRDAARIMEDVAATIRGEAYRAIKESRNGLTADETARTIGRSILAVRPRITELKLASLIERTGERRPNASNILAAVWRARS